MKININKTKLEEEKQLLENELGGLGRVDKDTDEWEAVPEEQTAPEADENDLADRSEDFEERSSTMTALETRLEDINHALGSIEDGTYGICEICGKKIEEDRLEVNPAARTCKECMVKAI
ncbi:MAG TPA: TraR/DksA C4-type zinc finger protein [Candidatus Paceibacterota bacterium]|nr:TraR/DksA C4-type zinc finger protein [Candidatus Paceibacterota bacterium]